MGILLLVLFIGMPIAEIAVFIEAGGRFGLWPTVAAVVVTAVIGTSLLRVQGIAVLRRAQESLNRGEMPLAEVFDGFCLVIAGALLLTPGFITDAIGFALLLPLTRLGLRTWAAKNIRTYGTFHTSGPYPGGPASGGPKRGPDGGIVIDGDFDEVKDDGENGDDAEPPRLGR